MDKENSLVSIYITIYNYGNFIEEAIESALNQSYKNIEIFIIDDGSNDDSRDIINSYLTIPKIKVVFQKNLGLTKSNNVALRLANGKYIVRLDADDRLKIDAIENLINGFVSDDVAMVFGNWDVIDENGNLIFNFKRHDFENDVSLMDCPAHGACTMFRVDYLRSIGGYDEDLKCQDGYELWFRIIDKFKVKNLEVSIFDYRRHGANLTGNEEKILSTRSRILKKISSEKGKQVDAFAPRPMRPRSWCSCARPKRSACSITITVAFGTSTPTSTTVVATRISLSWALNRRMTVSFSSPFMRPWTKATRGPNISLSMAWRSSAAVRVLTSVSSTNGQIQ